MFYFILFSSVLFSSIFLSDVCFKNVNYATQSFGVSQGFFEPLPTYIVSTIKRQWNGFVELTLDEISVFSN